MPLGNTASHLLILVALGLPACSSAPPPPVAAPESKSPFADLEISWTEPQCFGYRSEDGSYACLDFAFKTDATGPDTPEPLDFTTWKPLPDVAWGGHKAVELVGGERSVVKIAARAHGTAGDIENSQSLRAALVELEDKSFGSAGLTAAALEPGEWIDVAGASLRFRTQYTNGDDGDYHLGSLQLVCANAPVSSAVELLPEQRGRQAIAFAAADASSLVVSVLESGGQGGAWYFRINNVRVDLSERC